MKAFTISMQSLWVVEPAQETGTDTFRIEAG